MTRAKRIEFVWTAGWGVCAIVCGSVVARDAGWPRTFAVSIIGLSWGRWVTDIVSAFIWHLLNSQSHRNALKALREQGFLE